MKFLFFIVLLVICSSEILSQALFGTALIKGSVTLQIEETYEEYCQNILATKKETCEGIASHHGHPGAIFRYVLQRPETQTFTFGISQQNVK